MLSRVLLHVVATPAGIDRTMNSSSRSQGLPSEVQNTAVFLVRDFRNRYFPLVHQHQPAGIVYLAAAGGIKRSAVENDGMFALALNRFDDLGIEGVKKRVVIVETVSHEKRFAIASGNNTSDESITLHDPEFMLAKVVVGVMAVAAILTWLFDNTAGVLILLVTVIVAITMKRKQQIS